MRRSALDPHAARLAAQTTCAHLRTLERVESAGRIAAYRAVRGEVSLGALLDGPRSGCFTLPRVLGPNLEFVACHEGQRFAPGAFGILEPVDGEVVPLADHDAVLVPLVAFDEHCHRIGQGGGYYDRALASLPGGSDRSRPATIGVAYWFQQVARIPHDPWDVPLDAVATDRGVIVADGGLLA